MTSRISVYSVRPKRWIVLVLIYSAVAAETDRQIIQKVIFFWQSDKTLCKYPENKELGFTVCGDQCPHIELWPRSWYPTEP
jgi:hypothetical protein